MFENLYGLQIRENEFLSRENLLLEAYLAKVDFAKIGINLEDDSSKVCGGMDMLCVLNDTMACLAPSISVFLSYVLSFT